MYLIISALTLLLIVAALVDIITRDDWQVRHLPKLTWVLIVVFLPFIGSIVWFLVGHDWSRPQEAISFGDPRRMEESPSRSRRDDVDRPLTSTEMQLAALEAEIAAAEREERIRRLEAEVEARRRTAAPE